MYEFLEETVGKNMTPRVRSVAPETTVGDLYRLFAADNFDAYPVVRGDTLVGVVSKLDALKVFAFAQDQLLPHHGDGMGTTLMKSCQPTSSPLFPKPGFNAFWN
jgi:CBS domain-containing protein